MADRNKGSMNLKNILANNAVPIIFIGLSAIAIPISGFSGTYLIQEMLTRLARNSSSYSPFSYRYWLGWG
jgi:simple sugar transport system permease protein